MTEGYNLQSSKVSTFDHQRLVLSTIETYNFRPSKQLTNLTRSPLSRFYKPIVFVSPLERGQGVCECPPYKTEHIKN